MFAPARVIGACQGARGVRQTTVGHAVVPAAARTASYPVKRVALPSGVSSQIRPDAGAPSTRRASLSGISRAPCRPSAGRRGRRCASRPGSRSALQGARRSRRQGPPPAPAVQLTGRSPTRFSSRNVHDADVTISSTVTTMAATAGAPQRRRAGVEEVGDRHAAGAHGRQRQTSASKQDRRDTAPMHRGERERQHTRTRATSAERAVTAGTSTTSAGRSPLASTIGSHALPPRVMACRDHRRRVKPSTASVRGIQSKPTVCRATGRT